MRRFRLVYSFFVRLAWAGLLFHLIAAAAAMAQPSGGTPTGEAQATGDSPAIKIVPTPNIGHGDGVLWIALSADNQFLVTANYEEVKLWRLLLDEDRKVTSGRLLRTLQALPELPSVGIEQQRVKPSRPLITALAISHNGELVFAGDDRGQLHKWDAATGNLLGSVTAISGVPGVDRIDSLAITPDAETVIAAGTSAATISDLKGGISSWAAGTLKPLGTRDGGTWQLAVSPDGGSVVVSNNKRAELLGLPDLRPIRPLPEALNAREARITGDGSHVAVIQDTDPGVRWRHVSLADGSSRDLLVAANLNDAPHSIGPGGRVLSRNLKEGLNKESSGEIGADVIDLLHEPTGSGAIQRVRLTRNLSLDSAAFSADGFMLVTVERNTVELWDTRTGTLMTRLEGPRAIKSLSLSDDGKQLLAIDDTGAGFSWRTFQGELDRPAVVVDTAPDGLHLSFDGKVLVLNEQDRGYSLAALGPSGESTPVLPQGWRVIGGWPIPISPELGRGLIGIAREDSREIALWDMRTAGITHRLALPTAAGHPSSVKVNSDHSFAVVTTKQLPAAESEGSQQILWNLKTGNGETLPPIDGHPIADAALSPDGKWLVAGTTSLGDDASQEKSQIQLKDLANGNTRQYHFHPGQRLHNVLFSPVGEYLICLTSEGRYTFRTSDWELLEAKENSGAPEPLFLDKDRRVLGTQGIFIAGVSYGYDLRTGFGEGERTLLDLPTRPARMVDPAVDAKGERVAVADGSDVVVIRASDGAILARLAGHLADVSALRFLPDGNWLASGGRDGTVRLWNLRTKELAVTYTASKDGEWLAVTPAGFYAGSERPGRLMSVVQGLEVYSIEQFYGPLYRPNLVKERLSGDPMGLYKDAASKLNLGVVLERGAAPKVTRLEQPKRAGDTMQFTVSISNSGGGGIGKRLIWRVNGGVAGRTEPEVLANLTDPYATVTVRQGLQLDFNRKGGNEVSVVAFNGGDEGQALASEPLIFKIDQDGGVTAGDQVAPRMHVLAIGINSYDTRLTPNDNNLLTPLTLAVGDVQRLKGAIAEVSVNGGYKKGLMIERVEAEARRERIEDAFRELAGEVKPVDAFVLLIAGHGHSVAGRYYYYPVTTKFGEGRNNDTEGIAVEDWQKWIALVQVDKKLIVIDTCRSSDFLGRGEGDEDTAVDRLRRAVGRSVITAARDTAFESRHLKHGILTYAMLKALALPRADGRDITLSTLKERIPPDVKKLSMDLGQPAQKTRILVEDDFELGLPVPALAPTPVAAVETLAGEWIVKEETPARRSADDTAEVNETLKVGTPVNIGKFDGKWALIVHKGTAVGWALSEKLLKINRD